MNYYDTRLCYFLVFFTIVLLPTAWLVTDLADGLDGSGLVVVAGTLIWCHYWFFADW